MIHSAAPPRRPVASLALLPALALLAVAATLLSHRLTAPDSLQQSAEAEPATTRGWYPGKYFDKATGGAFHKESFDAPPGMPEGTKCNEVAPWLEAFINDGVQKVITEIPRRPKLSRMPLTVLVRVGLVETEVQNMSIKAIEVGQVRMGACRRPRRILRGVPRLLPDVLLVSIEDVNMTQALHVQYPGVFGVGAVAADAVSDMRGSLNLTIAFGEASDGSKVTACSGDFQPGATQLMGPLGVGLSLSATPLPFPVGKILCYGPQALLGPAAGALMDVTLEGAAGSVLEGKVKEFGGLVQMLNDFLAKHTPGPDYEGWYLGKNLVEGGQAAETAAEEWHPGQRLEGWHPGQRIEQALASSPPPPSPPPPGGGWWIFQGAAEQSPPPPPPEGWYPGKRLKEGGGWYPGKNLPRSVEEEAQEAP